MAWSYQPSLLASNFFWLFSFFSRRKIGKALGKTIKISAVGVYSFDGAHEQQKQVANEPDSGSRRAKCDSLPGLS